MDTSGTDFLSDSEIQAPVSPLHLAVSSRVCQDLTVSAMSITIRQKRCVSSIDLGLPRTLWSARGSPVIPAGSGRL